MERDNMSEPVRRESPLVAIDRSARGGILRRRSGVVLTEKPFLGHINLRGDPAAPDFSAVARSVIGFDLPLAANTVTASREFTVFWLGPDEWLMLTPGGGEVAVARDLSAALHGQFAAVTDVSGGQMVIALGGEYARDVLAKGCSLDLHPRVFGPGRCAQTHLARAGVLIHQRDDAPTFGLIVRRSFADYLWRWLEDAAAEYGLGAISDVTTVAPARSAASGS
jgi:sarcosine oxidase subunit gamma